MEPEFSQKVDRFMLTRIIRQTSPVFFDRIYTSFLVLLTDLFAPLLLRSNPQIKVGSLSKPNTTLHFLPVFKYYPPAWAMQPITSMLKYIFNKLVQCAWNDGGKGNIVIIMRETTW